MGCCADKKDKCCGISKVVIPAALGGHDGEYAPQNGAYQNTLVYYEASGVSYLYANDGSFEKLADGIAATIEIGETTTLTPGSDATVENVGTKYHAKLNFGIPQGEKGDAATISVGSTTTGAAGTDASVTNSGDEHDAVFDFVIPRGDKGDQGDAATINVGTVTTTTLEPGEQASATVTNSGTTENAVLDFGFDIPKGEKGDTGATGSIKSELADPLPATGQEDTYYLTNDSATKGTATGNPIQLNLANQGKIEELKLNGNASQTTYSGKNLLKYPSTSGSQTILGVQFTQSADGKVMASGTTTGGMNWYYYGNPNYFVPTESGQYTLSFTGQHNNMNLYCYDRTTSQIAIIVPSNQSSYQATGTLIAGHEYQVYFNQGSAGVAVSIDGYGQLEKGTQATSYEEWCGGTPAPNPDYPQDINVVTGEQNVEVVGKNLFSGDFSQFNSAGGTGNTYGYFKLPDDTNDYTLSIKAKNDFTTNPNQYLGLTADGGQATSGYFWAIQGNTTYTKGQTVTIRNLYYSTRLNYVSIYSNNSSTLQTLMENFDIQLELGNQASSYEPYQGQSYTIDLGSIELAKIGTYQDYIWNDGGTWKVHKAVGKVVLDGTQTITYQNNAFIYTQTGIKQTTATGDYLVMSDCYTKAGSNYRDSIANYHVAKVIGANDQIAIKDSRCTTVDDYKTWLGSNNVTVYYALETPTDTEITEQTLIDQLNAVANAQLYSGENNIMNIAFSPNLAGDLEIGYASWTPGDRYDVYIWNDSTGWQIIHTADS